MPRTLNAEFEASRLRNLRMLDRAFHNGAPFTHMESPHHASLCLLLADGLVDVVRHSNNRGRITYWWGMTDAGIAKLKASRKRKKAA